MGGVSTDVITGSVVGLTLGLLLATAAFAFAWQRRTQEYRSKEWRRLSDLNDQKTQIDRLTAELQRRTTEVGRRATQVQFPEATQPDHQVATGPPV